MESLSQVWINLLSNAIKFTGEKGRIEVTAFRSAGAAVVKIKDNGTGMSRETQKHIFEKFYQGDKSRLSEGNGLGLALVKHIIDMVCLLYTSRCV